MDRLDYRWTAFKTATVPDFQPLKYSQTDEQYTIFTYSLEQKHVCVIYCGEVPWAVIAAGYSQAQNDADKSDWETLFKETAEGPF